MLSFDKLNAVRMLTRCAGLMLLVTGILKLAWVLDDDTQIGQKDVVIPWLTSLQVVGVAVVIEPWASYVILCTRGAFRSGIILVFIAILFGTYRLILITLDTPNSGCPCLGHFQQTEQARRLPEIVLSYFMLTGLLSAWQNHHKIRGGTLQPDRRIEGSTPLALALLLSLGPRTEAAGLAKPMQYSVEGTMEHSVYGAKGQDFGKHTVHYHIYRMADRWSMRYTITPNSTGSPLERPLENEVAHDGRDLYRIFGTSSGQVSPDQPVQAEVRELSIPLGGQPLELLLWLAYCSDAILKQTEKEPQQFLPLLTGGGNAGLVVRSDWKYLPESGLPRAFIQHLKTSKQNEEQRDELFRYDVTESIDSHGLPGAAKASYYSRGIAGQQDYLSAQSFLKTDRILPFVSSDVGTLRLKGPARIHDARFATSTGRLYYLETNLTFLSRADPRLPEIIGEKTPVPTVAALRDRSGQNMRLSLVSMVVLIALIPILWHLMKLTNSNSKQQERG